MPQPNLKTQVIGLLEKSGSENAKKLLGFMDRLSEDQLEDIHTLLTTARGEEVAEVAEKQTRKLEEILGKIQKTFHEFSAKKRAIEEGAEQEEEISKAEMSLKQL
jgi:hypothetical protein